MRTKVSTVTGDSAAAARMPAFLSIGGSLSHHLALPAPTLPLTTGHLLLLL